MRFDEVMELVRSVGDVVIHPRRAYTREEYLQWSRDIRPYRLEILPDQSLLFMSPVSSLYSPSNAMFVHLLMDWAMKDGTGIAFNTDTGFDLPNGANRSPDAAWILKSRLRLKEWQGRAFWPICPDFVAEILSPSDSLASLQAKMQMWLDNGTRLAWLLDVKDERVWMYEPGQPVREINGFDQEISGDPVLPGFRLPLAPLRLPTA